MTTQPDACLVHTGCHWSSNYQSTHGNNNSLTDKEVLIRLYPSYTTQTRAHTDARTLKK